jgi:hypothetical protein
MIEKLDFVDEEIFYQGLSVGNKTVRLPNEREFMDKINEIVEAVNTMQKDIDNLETGFLAMSQIIQKPGPKGKLYDR